MKKFLTLFLTLAVLVAPASVLANGTTLSDAKKTQFNLDNGANSGPIEKLGTKLVQERKHVLKVGYDFDVHGGAVQAATPLVGVDGKVGILPRGAIVKGCTIDVITQGATSASGTVALGTGQSANDLKTATAAASYTGLVACESAAGTGIKMTADRTPTFSIATGALTGGKLWVLIEYVLSE